MKRVLIFSLTYHPFVGEAEAAVKAVTDGIDPGEYAFELITLRIDRKLPKTEQVGNVLVHRIGLAVDASKAGDKMPRPVALAKFLFPFLSFAKARVLHRKHRFDLIWALLPNHAAFGAIFFKAEHPNVPYLLELHAGGTPEAARRRNPVLRYLWWFYRQLYVRADYVAAASPELERITREGGYRGPVAIIPSGYAAVEAMRSQIFEPLIPKKR